MENLRKSLTLIPMLFLLLLLSSCGNDDDLPRDEMGLVNGNNINLIGNFKNLNNFFVLVSNQNGDILWDTVGLDLAFDINLEIDNPSDKIDVSYGYETTSGHFSINTYRNIHTGFTFGPSITPCNNHIETFNGERLIYPTDTRNIKLTIEGISEYDFFQFSFNNSITNGTVPDIDNNLLEITGSIYNKNDLFLTILPKGSSTYKSFTLKYEDWTIGEDLLSRTISFDDFTEPKIHTIDMMQEGDWIADATFLYANQQPCTIAKWNNYKKTQNGHEFKLFTPADAAIDKLLLKIRSSNRFAGNDLFKVYDGIPTQISPYKIGFDFEEFGQDNFNIKTTGSYDLADIKYEYIVDNKISSWDVYQRADCNLDYQLPEIPSYILEEMPLIKNTINNPQQLIAHFYDFDTDEYFELYDESQLQNKLRCLEYEINFDFVGF